MERYLYIIIMIALNMLSFISVLVLCYKYVRLRELKDSEFFTDYKHGNLTMRVFKPEFEFQAVGDLEPDKILDRGNLSQFYMWVLIAK